MVVMKISYFYHPRMTMINDVDNPMFGSEIALLFRKAYYGRAWVADADIIFLSCGFLWPPNVIRQTIIFYPVVTFYGHPM